MVKTKQTRRPSSSSTRPPGSTSRASGPGLTGFSQHVCSGSGPVSKLPPGAVLELQRSAGNGAVARLMAGRPPVVQRAEDGAGNPVVGLKRGDGLNFGTADLKTRVSILQSRLNDKMAAGLDPDGMFGARTGRALGDFEESVGQPRVESVNRETGDLLMDRNKVEPVPPPDNQLDEALEGRLDLIVNQYVKTLRAQNSALVSLERDLRVEEKANTSLLDKARVFLLQKAATFVIESLLGGFAKAGELFKVVLGSFLSASGAKDGSVTAFIADFGIDKVFELVHDKVIEGLNGELTQDKSAQRGSLELFIDAQRNGIFNATEDLLDKFSTNVKPKMRTLMPGPADVQKNPKDYRVERAQDLHIGVIDGSAKAFERQYFKSLQHYAAYKAQSDLDPNASQEEDLLNKGGTDMAKLQGKDNTSSGVRGVLEIHIPDIDDQNARQPIKILALHISGLSARARENINTNHSEKTIGELGLPRRMWDGNDSGLIPPRIDDVEVMIGRSEGGGAPTIIKSDAAGQQWVATRGGGSFEAGLTAAMNEVDGKKIADVESKKGIEEPG